MMEKMRNRKKRKGFTLIELIVVIAILAILAAIAIPRFGGFTDKAKIAADEQYAALVGNSAMVLLASGDIKISGTAANDTLTVNKDGVVSAIGTGVTGLADAAAVNTEIKKLVANKALVKDTDGFTVNLTADGYTISGLN